MARRGFVRRPANRPNYDWEGATTFSSAVAAAGVTTAQLFTVDTAETLVRVRGVCLVTLSAGGSAGGDSAIVGCGLIVISLGATVAVSPITEAGANWLWHQFFVLDTKGVVGAVADQGSQGWQRETVDNKAMRKLREDEALLFVVENQDVNGAPAVDVRAAFRVLTRR